VSPFRAPPVRIASLMAALGLAVTLGGCVTLFPKSKPAQLYRFGEGMTAQTLASPASAMAPVGLHLSTGFTRAAEGDRLLTVSDSQTAYIAQSRWVAPASVLFDEAAARAFETAGAPFHLLRRGDVGMAPFTLRLDVETFEADYGPAWSGSPTVVVRVRALLTGPPGHAPAAQVFESRQPAEENRVGAIVRAYDAATSQALGQVVGWTTAEAAALSSSG